MIIRCPIELERKRLDIFSKGHGHLSIDAGTKRHVQALDFILIGEGSHAA
jgi:hypothetical protein